MPGSELGEKLIGAAGKGEKEEVKELLAAGAEIDYFNFSSGKTPLIAAVTFQQNEMVQFLIEKKANVAFSNEGCSAACSAAKHGDGEMLNMLLAAIPDESSRHHVAGEALVSAVYGNWQDIIENLTARLKESSSYQDTIAAALEAAVDADNDIFQQLNRKRDALNEAALYQPLDKAARYGKQEKVAYIISQLTLQTPERQHVIDNAAIEALTQYSLHSHNKHKKIYEALLDAGADKNKALSWAVRSNNKAAILLIDDNVEKTISLFAAHINTLPAHLSSKVSTIKDPDNLYKLQVIIDEAKANHVQGAHVISDNGLVPEFVSTAVIHLPLLPAGSSSLAAIKRIKIVATDNKEAEEQTQIFKNGNVMMQLTYHHAFKEIFTISSNQCHALTQLLNKEHLLQDQAFLYENQVLDSSYWVGLAHYNHQVDQAYKKIHDHLVSKSQEIGDAVFLEIGAGTGALSEQLYETLSKTHPVHVIGTELRRDNVNQANKRTQGMGRIEFQQGNSVTLLDDLETTGAAQKIEEWRKTKLLVVNASGALNLEVLDHFQAVRAIQHICRLSPKVFNLAGFTAQVINGHIIKSTGFAIQEFTPHLANKGHFFSLTLRNEQEQATYIQHKERAIERTGMLDLSLNSHPLAVLTSLRPEILAKTHSINLSHSFVREGEAAKMAAHLAAHCPLLKAVTWEHHFWGHYSDNYVDDSKHIAQLQQGLSTKQIAYTTEHTSQPQKLAFSPGFVARYVPSRASLSQLEGNGR